MKKEMIYELFSHIPTLETERLILRRISTTDADDMFEYAKRQDVTKYLTWNPHPDIMYTREYLRYLATRYRLGDFYDWGVIVKDNNKMIGTCGFTKFDFSNNIGEIGFVLNPEYHGRGYAYEAAYEVLKLGFEKLFLHRIEAEFIDGNTPSRNLMERLGMKFEGFKRDGMRIKGEYKTIGVCSILKDEYSASRK